MLTIAAEICKSQYLRINLISLIRLDAIFSVRVIFFVDVPAVSVAYG